MPKGPASALRGGSYNNTADNCRVAYRNQQQPDNDNNNIGLRLVRCVLPHATSAMAELVSRQGAASEPVQAGMARLRSWRGGCAWSTLRGASPTGPRPACESRPARPTLFASGPNGARPDWSFSGFCSAGRHPWPQHRPIPD